MPSPNDSTFDLDPPRRPSLGELGGGAKENHPKRPPDPVKHPTAEEFNHYAKLFSKVGVEMALARLLLTFSGGTPSVVVMFAARAGMVAGDFAVTDNGAGDTTISWTTGVGGMLPPTTGQPTVSQADDVEIDRLRAYYTTDDGNPAVRVMSKLGATGTDCTCVVTLY